MKVLKGITLTIFAGLLLGSGALLIQNNKVEPVKADSNTDMDDIVPDNGEQLDKANMIYDDFSSGLNLSTWAVSNKAWGNSSVSYNSGVIPENVFYNSTDKSMVFRALGDYYQDNDVNYSLHSWYGYAHDGSTGGGRVYSKDGTRTGGCIKTRDLYGPGRFEAKFKVAPIEGVCTAFWTFNYGDHGEDGYNETDFELPTYIDSSDKTDLSFNRIICTTYLTEENYKSQRVTNPVYLNDNQYHTYCLDWYYSNNTKKVNWFIDGNLIATWNQNISRNAGRVTLGVWIPGRDSFCGIPNFDKAYMELDYFKYTPFKNQDYEPTGDSLVDRETSNTYYTITETPKAEFVPNGSFNYGITDLYGQVKDIEVSKEHNYSGANSYGIKIAGNDGTGESRIQYTQPNVRGIAKLEYSFMYRGYGSTRFNSGNTQVFNSGTLASRNEWAEFKETMTLDASDKTFTLYIVSESNDFGFFVDDIKVTFVEEAPEPPTPVEGIPSYSFFTKNNGQTSDSDSKERTLYLNNDSYSWRIACGKYTTTSGRNVLNVKPNSNVMSSTSGDYYYPFKQCLSSNGFTDSDNAALLAMEFDVENFTDLEIVLYSYAGVSGRKIYTLASIDEGTSWTLMNTQSLSSSDKDDSDLNFRYDYRINVPNQYKGQTIRLAFVGNAGSNNDAYQFSGVIINNFQNFKDKLDAATCNADTDTQAFLAHQYANLTSSELTLLETETMKNYDQSYAYGYQYLLTYWSSINHSSYALVNIKKNSVVIIAVISGVLFTSLVSCYFFIRRKRFNR